MKPEYPAGEAMEHGEIGRILWRAAEDEDFRRRALQNLGMALAEEGFIVSDAAMAQLRGSWEEIASLPTRTAYERIQALARGYRR